MPHDRGLLVASMVLQSAVSLTFGLAFLGLWKGFHRPTAARWAVAWLVYAVGVVFGALSIGLGLGAGFSPVGLALLGLPLQFGVVLFRAGTDSLIEREGLKVERYVMAGVVIFGIFLVLREAEAARIIPIHPGLAAYILPRILMGVSYGWVAWPLRTLARRRWAEGHALMAGALVCLSARMFVTAGYEVWQIGHGAASSPESPLLTFAQLCFLIAFGVATALVLVEAERLAAVHAAQTVQDTSDALRASEARFRFVVEHSSDVQAIVGADHRIRYVAPSCERLIGLPPSVFEGRIFMDLIHPDDCENVTKALARMQADPSGRRPPTSVRIQNRSGEWMPFDVTGQLVPQEGAAGDTMVLSLRDMAAQRQLEVALLQTRKMEAIGQLAGGVAHDFNNVLTAIVGFCELVLRDPALKASHRRDVSEIGKAADRATRLTQQLLAFSRRQILQPKVLDLNALVGDLKPMLRRLVFENIDLIVSPRPATGLVTVDPTQFEQVLVNLSVNARDAMPKGGKLMIEITDVTLDDAYQQRHVPVVPGDYVMLAVSDTGVGMDLATRQRMFEPFFTTKEADKGTGLGLATVYGIVKQSDGYIWVYSEPGRGTTFKIYLPRAVQGVGAANALSPDHVDQPRGWETVLVAEDDEGLRRLACRALESIGYHVLEAGNPREAVETASEYGRPIHLLLSDVVMPESEGPPLIDRLAGVRPGLRVLYMSGYPDEAIVHYGVLNEGIPFLQKPFTPQTLARKVRDVLDAPPPALRV